MKLKFKNMVCAAALVFAMTATMPGLAFAAETGFASGDGNYAIQMTGVSNEEETSGESGIGGGTGAGEETGSDVGGGNASGDATAKWPGSDYAEYTGLLENSEDGVTYYVKDGKVLSYTGLYIENSDEKLGLNTLANRYYLIDGALQKKDGVTEIEGENAGIYYLEQGQLKSVQGVYENSVDGKLYYFSRGRFDHTASGLGRTGSDGYYLRNGIVDTSFTGMTAISENGQYSDWYYVKNGRCVGAETGEYYYYTGFAWVDGKESYHDGKEGYYYVKNNRVQWDMSGLNNINGSWYYFKNGQLEDSYTGLVSYNNSWFYVESGKINWSYSGLAQVNGTGSWYYVKNGEINWSYTGLAQVNGKGDWYRVENGKINWNYTGLVNFNGGWYYLQNGVLNWKYTNLVKYNGSWYYVKNSTIDWKCTTLAQVNGKGAWYYVKNGAIDWKYTGLAQVDGKGSWYRVENGKLNWNYTGLVNFNGGWYYLQNGVLNWNYSNLVQYKGNWYYVKNGKIDWKCTTLAQVNGKGAWYYVKNGAIDWKYTGLAQVDGKGSWYRVENGKLNWNYTGLVNFNGGWYYLQNGVLNWNYSNLVQYKGNWYYVKNGAIDWHYTTLAQVNGKGAWYYVKNGAINWKYTGLAQVDGKGTYYYVQNGKLNWNATGPWYTSDGTRYDVKNGVATKYVHQHTWKAETETIYHDALTILEQTFKCKCGYETTSIDEFNSHIENAEAVALSYADTNVSLAIEKLNEHGDVSLEETTRTIVEAYSETVTIKNCSTCGENNENDGHEHQWINDVVDHEAKYSTDSYHLCSCGRFFLTDENYDKHMENEVKKADEYISTNTSIFNAIMKLHSTSGVVDSKKLVSEPYQEIIGQKCSICGKTKK